MFTIGFFIFLLVFFLFIMLVMYLAGMLLDWLDGKVSDRLAIGLTAFSAVTVIVITVNAAYMIRDCFPIY